MIFTVSVAAITVAAMIISVLFFPKIKIGKKFIDSYWIITLIGAVILVIFKGDVNKIISALTADTSVNPIKILVIFISMTILSIFLDELGVFRFLAEASLKKAGKSQIKLFITLYLTVSVLTVFTSNDVIILSFTPFICYFARNAKIDPIPYLAAEFVAANTWSMALIIGNPTNIYLCSAFGVDFITYLKTMALPTIAAGGISLALLILVFGKKLKTPIENQEIETHTTLSDKPSLILGVATLSICTIFLAVSSYLKIEMWIVCLSAVAVLFVGVTVISLLRKRVSVPAINSVKRAPWQIIPFVLSMFVMIIILADSGVTEAVSKALGEEHVVLKYGVLSFLSSNVINNIPMSVLFCEILKGLSVASLNGGVFATVIGSNLGAAFTPIGALAGIMFGSILSLHGIKFGYKDFLKIGVTVTLPSLVCSLVALMLVV